MNYLRNKAGFKPVKKYDHFILFEKEVNGNIIRETFRKNEIPLLGLTKEDRRWIERN